MNGHQKPRKIVNAIALLAVAAAVALLSYWMYSPAYYASQIELRDSRDRVRALLGEPAAVFLSTDQLRRSSLRSGSYVFKSVDGYKADGVGEAEIEAHELPAFQDRAEWFPYGSAGHLVYFDVEGVSHVFRGGT